ncbi:hypothetical protein ANN_20248 [Periplaneta americana]|uniref:Uncharacterized protein n=1 Tax=Periplaneta americana TaxID=6978 RepID=A0ABQ8SC53_PERAM|nr:hypothetical protein ANN_20248 [Periplaneta americana]
MVVNEMENMVANKIEKMAVKRRKKLTNWIPLVRVVISDTRKTYSACREFIQQPQLLKSDADLVEHFHNHI